MNVPPISPIIFYRDARAALDFLERAFGFETRMVVDDGQGGVIHSESVFEEHVVMVCGPPPAPKYASPLDLGGRRTGSIHVQLKRGSTPFASVLGRPARPSSASRPTSPTATASSPASTPRATPGRSGRRCRP